MSLSRSACLPAVLALGALAALTGGCAKKPLPVVQAEPGEVEYAGCYEVQRAGPVCYLGKSAERRTIFLHPTRKAAHYEVRAGGKVYPTTPIESSAGPLFQVTVPAAVSLIELQTKTGDQIRVWPLQIATWPSMPAWLDQALELYSKGPAQYKAAMSLLDANIGQTSDVRIRVVASSFRAALEPKENDPQRWFSAVENVIAEYRDAGLVQGGAKLTAQLSFELIQRHDFTRARAILQAERLPLDAPVEAVRRIAHHRGLLAESIGDFRTALGEFQSEADLASRLGLTKHRDEAEQEEARVLTQLGRFKDAEALLSKLTAGERSRTDPCGQAILYTNRGWARYLARDAGEWNLGDPIEPFTSARAIYVSQRGCVDQAREEFNATLNLALALLQSNRIAEAERVISGVDPRARRASPLDRMWWLDLLARVALQRKKPARALALYDQLAQEARDSLSTENQWRAAFGKAMALEAQNHLHEAAEALAGAERLVDFQLTRIPVGEGRESFTDQWSAGSRLYVEILLRTGQVERALLAARRARGRVLSKLAESARLESFSNEQREERDARLGAYWKLRNELDGSSKEGWQAPKNQSGELQSGLQRRLRETQQALDRALDSLGTKASPESLPLARPQGGDVLLAYFPLSSARQWAAFCDTGKEISAKEFTMPGGSFQTQQSGPELAKVLLRPFETEIGAARRVIVLPYGILKTVDFQALPFGSNDEVLISRRPVVYGLDIPRFEPDRASTNARRALVVSDSREDLPEARKEGMDVDSSLRGLDPPWEVSLLQGRAATAPALRQSIARGIDLLHYAGHADFSGRGGWESQIPLANQTRLTLGDLLTFERQPQWVVLSGCETGASDDSAQVESQGLAHAFLLGGSRAVVAATRKVNDKIAHQLILEMYRNLEAEPDLAVLLQKAQLTLRKRGLSQREWASFRVFEP